MKFTISIFIYTSIIVYRLLNAVMRTTLDVADIVVQRGRERCSYSEALVYFSKENGGITHYIFFFLRRVAATYNRRIA